MAAPSSRPTDQITACGTKTTSAARLVARLAILAFALASRKPYPRALTRAKTKNEPVPGPRAPS
ncbi:hypothetical protein BJF82_16070 [Kytococcus sp. CUA-901]|nr:hypothetical protein BJF82_16070 [Kytococcus sp. CUA-901]